MGIANHEVRLIRISAENIRKHPNADSLSIVTIGGYQIVVKTEEFPIGTLAAYIQPDSVLPDGPAFAWFWAPNAYEGGTPIKRRRVTVRKFRGEWSEGLLVAAGNNIWTNLSNGKVTTFQEGEDVAEFLGITHYEPPEDVEGTRGDNENGPGAKQNNVWPRSLKGWLYFLGFYLTFGLWNPNKNHGGTSMRGPSFRPVYDVEAYKNFVSAIPDDTDVIGTEKIHGSNARYTFEKGKMYAGSRKLWKSPASNCIWRKVLTQYPRIQQWCESHEGYTLYGEVVPTQAGFDYGCLPGETKFFLFDILDPEGNWVSRSAPEWMNVIDSGIGCVPVLSRFEFSREKAKALDSGPSMVTGAGHIREGVVIRPWTESDVPPVHGLGRVQLKLVSNKFLEKDSK
jgi:RNA ligase